MANMKLELNYVPESVLRSRQRRREAGRFSYFHMLVILLLFVPIWRKWPRTLLLVLRDFTAVSREACLAVMWAVRFYLAVRPEGRTNKGAGGIPS